MCARVGVCLRVFVCIVQINEGVGSLLNLCKLRKRDQLELMQSEKRIEMPPMKFLFLSVRLVVDLKLRCKSVGEDYPFGVPHAVTKLLELDIVSVYIYIHITKCAM